MAHTFCLIDDEREICEVLRLFFESRGHICHVAHDGETGLALVKKHRPRAVFLDLAMPRMNGVEVLAAIRKDPDIADTPVMMITGVTHDSNRSDEEWARSVGANAFMTKPFEFEALLATVQHLTGVEV